MITVIKTASIAEAAIPLHGHQRPARRAKPASAGASAAGNEAGAAHAMASKASQPSPASAYRPPSAQYIEHARSNSEEGAERAAAADEKVSDERYEKRIDDALMPAVPGTYAEGYEDGHAEGLREGYRKGREEGLAEGLEQGHRDACETADARSRQATALADAISAASAAWETALEAGAVEIAYAAVLRIIGQTMCSRDAVVAMVRKVMEQLPERRALSIHLSPSDHALLEADAQLAPLGGVKLVPDERVDIGGCIVETDAGSLDGRLETQLAGLRDLLLSLHRSGGERE